MEVTQLATYDQLHNRGVTRLFRGSLCRSAVGLSPFPRGNRFDPDVCRVLQLERQRLAKVLIACVLFTFCSETL